MVRKLQVGVKVLLKNASGKYLLIYRSHLKYPKVQIGWDVVGGRIKPGVSLLLNLKREVKEETGLTLLKVERLLAAQDILRTEGKHVVRITYLGKAKGKIKLDKEENSEYKWFSLKELKKLRKKSLDMYFAKVLEEFKQTMVDKEQDELIKEVKKAKKKVKVGGRYFHYKHPDRFYTLLRIGFIEETERICVIYEAEYGKRLIWVRPLEDFTARVKLADGTEVKRFTKMKESG